MVYFGMDIKYIAGLFDGEGYVGVVHQKTHDCYTLRVTISNTNPCVFPRLAEMYRSAVVRSERQAGCMVGYDWVINGPNALVFLRDIAPHVYIKKDQVDLALTFPVGKNRAPVSPEDRALRADIYRKLKLMKRSPPVRAGKRLRRSLESDVFVQRAVSLHGSGMSAREVGEELGVKGTTASYWIRQLGLGRDRGDALRIANAKRFAGFYERPEIIEAKALYESGLSAHEVAKKLKRKPATVNYWLRKMGLTRSLSEAAKLRCEKESK